MKKTCDTPSHKPMQIIGGTVTTKSNLPKGKGK